MPSLEPGVIYLTVFAPKTAPAAHRWALFVPCSVGTSGRLFRAAGKPTTCGRALSPPGLIFEAKEYDLLGDPRLFLLLKLGVLGERPLDDLHHKILAKVSIPNPDDEYGRSFDGRTWVIKAIMRMSAYGIIESRRLEMTEQGIHDLTTRAFSAHSQRGGWTLGTI